MAQKRIVLIAVALSALVSAQPPPPASRPAQPPRVTSPEVAADRRITFRIFAPQAEAVRLAGSDIPGNGQGAPMTKGENGIWEVTMGPVEPGAYRYNFNIGGIPVVDPRNPGISESNDNVWSLVPVPGSDFMDTKQVPHGAVASVTYYSASLGRFRRMHVYTPPGYQSGKDKFPVFYLLHGASDSDDSWTSVGRAGFILDNLVASNKAKPMIVVMPAGHTTSSGFRPPTSSDDFTKEFVTDIMPYVEKNYRTIADRNHRAIAGLSMGGGQTLNVGFSHLDTFAYIGVFSSGLFTMFPISRPGAPPPPSPPAGTPNWEQEHLQTLDNKELKKGLKLLWFGTGKDDFLVKTSRSTVDLLKQHGFNPVYNETAGAHTWLVWRNYLIEFVPQLF